MSEKRRQVGLHSEVDAAVITACTGFVEVAKKKLERYGFSQSEISRILLDPAHRRLRVNAFLMANGYELRATGGIECRQTEPSM
jgi:hypothetical protein